MVDNSAAARASGRRPFAASARRKSATTRTCSSRRPTSFRRSGAGSHNMTFGYDSFNDMRFANNHQSGSDYRIYNTGTIMRGTGDSAVVYPVFLGDGSTFIQWNPIPCSARARTSGRYSAFVNDAWRVNDRLTANLGFAGTRITAKTSRAIWWRKTARSARASASCSTRSATRMVGHRELRAVRRGAQQLDRRLGVGRRQSPDIPVIPIAARASTPTRRRHADALRRRRSGRSSIGTTQTAARTCRCGASPTFPA